MAEYLAPGVYVEEISSGAKPIDWINTSIAGFIGLAEFGPEEPKLITNWDQFQRVYGSYNPDQSYLAYAVDGFFVNGGQQCFVSRVVAQDANRAQLVLGKTLTIAAIGRGAAGGSISVSVSPTSHPKWQNIKVRYKRVIETYQYQIDNDEQINNLVVAINNSSNLVRVWRNDAVSILPENKVDINKPGEYEFTALSGANLDGVLDVGLDAFVGYEAAVPFAIEVARNSATNNQAEDEVTITSSPNELFGRSNGLMGLALIDEISLLIVPDQVNNNKFPNNTLTKKIIEQCETLKDRFAIISSIQSDVNNINTLRPPIDSSYAGFYFPWIEVLDPTINMTRLIPSTGHIAGVFARIDVERGVHKAPSNEVVRGVVDLQVPINQSMQDLLNPQHVNCIRDFRTDGRGIRLWGARTMSSDPEWKYVNTRRLFMFIEKSISQGIQWVVFEPNNEAIWSRIRLSVINFLQTVWREGALMGSTEDEAFFVRCDRTTMTQNDIDNGRLICVIGIAPLRPAEFVIIRIGQKTANAIL